jgi:serine/threonine-protein kinase
MSAAGADRNLLYGMLALQMELVSRDALITAMQAWMRHREKQLGEILVVQGVLAPEQHTTLDRLVQQYLVRLDDADLAASLADLSQKTVLNDHRGATAVPLRQRWIAPRYRVVRQHATGGLGQVSLALDEQLNREVALKQIQERLADDPGCQARFLREAEITARLEHPGIVPVYGMDTDERGRPRYAMRFVRGNSLHEDIERFHRADQARRDPTERALALRGLLRRFLDVCNAVAYAHSRGVIHRDVKPANVMLGDYGETLVVDWGLARQLEQDQPVTQPHHPIQTTLGSGTAPTQQGQVVGTLAFISPEQARGEQERVGTASDVFALGATLFCLLTGHPPYRGKHSEVLAQACRGEVVPARQVNPRVPAALEAVCNKALATIPDDRYGSARELAFEVERWLADEPVQAHREGLGTRLRRWGRRNRTVVAGAVVLLVASVVGLGLGLWAVSVEKQKTEHQRDLAQEAEEAARHAEGVARRQLARAETNLKLAQNAVDECFGLASENSLLQLEALMPVRKLLLQKTLVFYQNFRLHNPEDRKLALLQAEYLFRVAYITAETDRKAEAVTNLEKARDVLAALSAAHPQLIKLRANLALILNNLGAFQRQMGKPSAAVRKNFEQARDIQAALCKAHPHEPRYWADLATTWTNLGNLHRDTGQPQAALKSFEQARDIQLELSKAHPQEPRYWADLATTWTNLGNLQRDTGQPKEALNNFEHARDIQLALSAAHAQVGAYRADLARTWNNLGTLQAQTGEHEEARASYQQARDLLLALSKAHPQVTEYRADLAGTWNNLGNLQRQMGKAKEAVASYQQARDLQQALTRAYPDVPLYQADLARTWNNLGIVQRDRGELDDALASAERARDILRVLSQAHSDAPRYRADLAGTWNNLGTIQTGLGKPRAAARSHAQARDLLLALDRAHPGVTAYQVDLAGACLNLGLLSLRENRPPISDMAKVVALFDQAIALLAAVRQREPDHATAREVLRNCHIERAKALALLGRHGAAAADWEQAARLDTSALRVSLRVQRALALAHAGEHAQAVTQAERLLRLGRLPGTGVYNLACVYALSARATAGAATRPLAQREKQAEQHARIAVGLLQVAQRAGFFRARPTRDKLKKDGDLDYLRRRDDFRQLVSRVEGDEQ